LNEAAEHFILALQLDPQRAMDQYNLALVYSMSGMWAEAIHQYRAAIQNGLKIAELYNDLGAALLKQERWPEAEASFREAIRFTPKNIEYRCRLASVLLSQGKQAAARAQYQQTLDLDPKWPKVIIQRAQVLATHPDAKSRNGAVALELAQNACNATG